MNTALEFAAANPVAYAAQAHQMLERAGVPRRYRLFDHAAILKLVEKRPKEETK